MDAAKKADTLRRVLGKLGAGGADIQTAEWLEAVDAQNDGFRTGPEIGSKVPEFALPDQSGKLRSLPELAGPNGLLLLFSRSADW
jgi:hypothetical protein